MRAPAEPKTMDTAGKADLQACRDIWILAEHRQGTVTAETLGLVREALRLLCSGKGDRAAGAGKLVAVTASWGPPSAPETLGAYGVDRVLTLAGGPSDGRGGPSNSVAAALADAMRRESPAALLAVQGPETADLCARLGARLESAAATHVVDLQPEASGWWTATRPVHNGYLFETLQVEGDPPPIFCFSATALMAANPIRKETAAVEAEAIPVPQTAPTQAVEVLQVMEADPETLDLEDAEIIVAGGRGVGNGAAFEVIHDLARLLGASVAGTRPAIDRGDLPYERQIGQTGKTVRPRLILNFGISGANEYTAGMEESDGVIAVNTDPRARIFRFCDLGVVADAAAFLPRLISRIQEIQDG